MPPLLTPFLTQQRRKAILPYVRGDILDLGCGLAQICHTLQPEQTYIGIENPTEYVNWLRVRYPQHTFLQRDLEKEPINLDRCFETVIMGAIIEHLKEPGFLLQQIPGYLEPGGRLVITTPTPLGDKIHRLGARLGLFSMDAVEEHQKIYDRGALTGLLAQYDFSAMHYQYFLLGGNQLLVCQPGNTPTPKSEST
ncbi:MAG: methyltransferase domain-containing protein [Chloroflexota bacterium]